MDVPTMIGSRSAAADTTSLVSYFPIPFYGLLPVNAFLLRSAQPVLVDTGLSALRDSFLNHLRSLIDLKDLQWLWLGTANQIGKPPCETSTHPGHTHSLRFSDASEAT